MVATTAETTVPKALGRDCELSTSGVDARGRALDPWHVTRAVLDHVGTAFAPRGFDVWRADRRRSGPSSWGAYQGGWSSARSSDCLRSWAPNGDCYYSDMSHVECCSAETHSPLEFAARSIALLRVAEAARAHAELEAEPGVRYSLSAANVDAWDPAIAWGSHVNVQVSRRLFDDLFVDESRPAVLGFVASAIAAGVAFFGAGYVLPLKEGPVFSASARAHHLSCVKSISTTEAFRRGLLNTRREAHARDHERLHLIGFDFAPGCSALLAAYLQCVLAAAELGFCGPTVYEPVAALRAWSWELDTDTGRPLGRALTSDRRRADLPTWMRELAEALLAMCASGSLDGAIAPETPELLARIVTLCAALNRGELTAAARHLDWAAKWLVLNDVRRAGDREWDDASVRLFDHDFANTDPRRGPFWKLWSQGLIDPLVDEARVQRALLDGPDDSRAFARGRLIQRHAADITGVDWDHVELALQADRWQPRLRIEMPTVASLARRESEALLDGALDVAALEARARRSTAVESSLADPRLEIAREIALPPSDSDGRGGSDPRPD
jgi:proteasome accessory factor A